MADHPDCDPGPIAGDVPVGGRVAVASGDAGPSGPPTQGGGLDHALDRLLPLLAAVGLEPTSTELADILWLAARLRLPSQPGSDAKSAADESARHTETPGEQEPDGKAAETPSRPDPDDGSHVSPSAKLYPAGAAVANGRPAIGFRAPAEPALANALEFFRALRPLHRRVSSRSRRLLDEDTTAERIAEQRLSGHRFWAPAWTPAREPWFELALVIDRGATMAVWRETLDELRRLFDTSGAFRRTRQWCLETDGPEPRLYAGAESQGARLANPESLTAGPERRLILVASDCVGAAWHTGAVNRWLALWGAAAPAALLQLLPQRLWGSTALGRGRPVRLRSRWPGAVTSELEPIGAPSLRLNSLSAGSARGPSSAPNDPGLHLPVLTLEPPALLGWGRLLGGVPDAWCGGVQFGPDTDYAQEMPLTESEPEPDQAEVLARLADFRATASPLARRLASLLAAAPLTLPVMRLVQRTRLPESGQGHLAEILVSGLLRRHPELDAGSDQPFYDFLGHCRDLLLDGLGEWEARGVLDAVSDYVAERTGGVLDFSALIVAPDASALTSLATTIPDAKTWHFARIGATVLRRLGGSYSALAERLAEFGKGDTNGASLEADLSDWDELPDQHTPLAPQPFRDVFLDKSGQGPEMVWLPGGKFHMGSPGDVGHPNEHPLHEVTLTHFAIGKYPITVGEFRRFVNAARYRTDAEAGRGAYVWDGMKAGQRRDANWRNPYFSQAEDHPIVCLSWNDANAYCNWLAEQTGRSYRLLTEAQWEFACRAGSGDAYCFGNNKGQLGDYARHYKNAAHGTHRVGEHLANAWGLHDLHGHVWEWCSDWFGNYPSGSTQDPSGPNVGRYRVARGGSWQDRSDFCRSAFRSRHKPMLSSNLRGFRICRSGPRHSYHFIPHLQSHTLAAAQEALQDNADRIRDALFEQFDGLGFILEDQDGDVEDAHAAETRYEAKILTAERNAVGDLVLTFSLVGIINFTAELSYGDMDSATYDSEEKEYMFLHYVHENVERETEFSSTITLTLESIYPYDCEVSLTWGEPLDVNVVSSVEEDWPYK